MSLKAKREQPATTTLDRQYIRWINQLCGAPSDVSPARTVIYAIAAAGEQAKNLPSTARAELNHNATAGRGRLPQLTASVLARQRVGEVDVHVVPQLNRKSDMPPQILIRLDADAHGDEQDAEALIDWVGSKYFPDLYACPSKQGYSGYVLVEFAPLTRWVSDPLAPDSGSFEPMRGTDGRLIYPGQHEINAMLDEVGRCLAKLARDANFDAKLELKGRFHVIQRPSFNYKAVDDALRHGDDGPAQQLGWYREHRTKFNADHPLKVTDYGQAVKLPPIATDSQMTALKAARSDQSPLSQIITDAGATHPDGSRINWANIRTLKDARRSKVREQLQRIDQMEAEEAGLDQGEWTSTKIAEDELIIRDELASYMERAAACARLALRETKGNISKSMPIALRLMSEENGGPATGPCHADRERLMYARLRYALKTFNAKLVGGGRRQEGWFDPEADNIDMLRRQTGLVSSSDIAQANAEHPRARLDRRKLSVITNLMIKSIATGRETEVSSKGLQSFAAHEHVACPGINGSTIAAAKALLIASGQMVRVGKHSTDLRRCERWKLGPRVIVQEWALPIIKESHWAPQKDTGLKCKPRSVSACKCRPAQRNRGGADMYAIPIPNEYVVPTPITYSQAQPTVAGVWVPNLGDFEDYLVLGRN